MMKAANGAKPTSQLANLPGAQPLMKPMHSYLFSINITNTCLLVLNACQPLIPGNRAIGHWQITFKFQGLVGMESCFGLIRH